MSAALDYPPAPPWLRFPYLTETSLGWRMGLGESYIVELGSWLGSLSDAERSRYRAMFPTPASWRYHDLNERDLNDADEPAEAELGVRFWRRGGEPAFTWAALSRAWEAGPVAPVRYFWKPRPGVVDEHCLGQWQPTTFREDVDTFTCAEQYMMAAKARLFNDEEIRVCIMASDSPREMKNLGKKVRGFRPEVWDAAKHSIVLAGNWAKFTQDRALREFLLSTGDDLLVEASPMDTIWGIGLGANSPRAADPRTWRGHNLLGFALMEVRDEIRRVYANADLLDVPVDQRQRGFDGLSPSRNSN